MLGIPSKKGWFWVLEEWIRRWFFIEWGRRVLSFDAKKIYVLEYVVGKSIDFGCDWEVKRESLGSESERIKEVLGVLDGFWC